MRLLLTNYHCLNKTIHYRPGEFARQLAGRNHDVTVLCTSDNAHFGIEQKVIDGVQYVLAPDLLWGKLRTGWDMWNMISRMRHLGGRQFDLVHSYETRPATIYPVLSLLKKNAAPLVIDWIDWWGHGGLIKENRPLWYQLLFGWLETYYEEHFRCRADATTVISRALASRAESLGVSRDTIYRIPNGVNSSEYPQTTPQTFRGKFDLPNDAFIVADSARDVFMGIETSFQAVAEARKRNPNVLFIMTGDNSSRLLAKAKKAGVADAFRHFGHVSFSQMAEILSCADAFLMPLPDCVANRGRWPGRVGPYLALGRPVISNAVGEMKWLLDERHVGLACEGTASFAEAILRLGREESTCERLSQNARRTAEELTWGNMTDRLESCYNDAINRWRIPQGKAHQNQ